MAQFSSGLFGTENTQKKAKETRQLLNTFLHVPLVNPRYSVCLSVYYHASCYIPRLRVQFAVL